MMVLLSRISSHGAHSAASRCMHICMYIYVCTTSYMAPAPHSTLWYAAAKIRQDKLAPRYGFTLNQPPRPLTEMDGFPLDPMPRQFASSGLQISSRRRGRSIRIPVQALRREALRGGRRDYLQADDRRLLHLLSFFPSLDNLVVRRRLAHHHLHHATHHERVPWHVYYRACPSTLASGMTL